jgi:hypothetical protein
LPNAADASSRPLKCRTISDKDILPDFCTGPSLESIEHVASGLVGGRVHARDRDTIMRDCAGKKTLIVDDDQVFRRQQLAPSLVASRENSENFSGADRARDPTH